MKVTAKQLARNVYLTSAANGFFDDNFFDLLPGETATVTFRPEAATTAEVASRRRSRYNPHRHAPVRALPQHQRSRP